MTIDFEDWYEGLELDPGCWPQHMDRIEQSSAVLLEVLNELNTKATIFVSGYLAKRHPGLIRSLAEQGHEIGSHGYNHDMAYRHSKDAFTEDLRKSKQTVEAIIGKPVYSYRAPFFSITGKTPWAFRILADEGFKLDSSIAPVLNYRYGQAGFGDKIRTIDNDGSSIIEAPVSSFKMLGLPLGLTGGFYFRFFPLRMMISFIKNQAHKGQPTIFYIHPWDLDEEYPPIKRPLRIQLTRNWRLNKTKEKLTALLKVVPFTSFKNANCY